MNWGFNVVTAEDGEAAIEILNAKDAPSLAIIDWMNGVFRQNNADLPMESYTREEYKRQTVKGTTGTVNRMYVDYQLGAPVAYLWPVAVQDTGLVLGTDGLYTFLAVG